MAISTINVAALNALEQAINRALEMDDATRERLVALQPTVFHVRCTVPDLQMYIVPENDRISLYGHYEEKATCSVSGAASDYIALVAAKDKASALVNGNLKISGDSSKLLELEKIISVLDVDWEARLALFIGDAPAHQLGRIARSAEKWRKSAHTSFERHLGEFIKEEARLSPPPLEVEDFFADLQQLAVRTDRAEAAIRRLKRRASALAEKLGNRS